MKASDPPIIVHQSYNQSQDTVWNAITKPDQMRQWFFNNIPDFRPEVGFETQFLITNEGRHFTHCWKIIDVIPGQKITYSWSYPEYPGHAHVAFELTPQESQTQLILTNTITEDFPQDIPEFKRESCIGGWEYFIQGQLKEYLDR